MEVVMGALPTVLTKLGELLVGEYNLQSGLKGEIMFLQTELACMQAAMEKVSEVPTEQLDNQARIWAREVRELSYNIEDSLDDFMVRLQHHEHEATSTHGFRQFFGRCLDLLTRAKVRHKIATDIKDIKRLVKEAAERRDRYNLRVLLPAKPPATVLDTRLLVRYKNVADLVGADEARDEIIEKLLECSPQKNKQKLIEAGESSKQQLKIVSVVGFGGLGKTTIVNLVYQKLKVQFDCAAFVAVSQNPDVKKIFKDMLHQLDKEKYSYITEATMDETQLIQELREFLLNKRYLIVIDDIWDTKAWEVIKCALVENDNRNTVITTTRLHDIAQKIGGPYNLKPLPPDTSKILFHGRIFGGEDQCPDHLAGVSKILLKKCGGVPLAIITVAGLLANKKGDTREWYQLCESIGSGLHNSPDVKEMRKILALSYYHLPTHLKTCLVYLSIFPEDYTILRDELIWRWIGEGFLHGVQEENLFEVGESYFTQLINRGMIQPVDINVYDKATACRVHDMVMDLISSISIEENFATVLYDKKATTSAVKSKVRRLSLYLQDAEMPQGTMVLSHVRSLTVSEHSADKMPPLSSFPALRVLDLDCKLQEPCHVLQHLGSLGQLRYLILRGTSIRELPNEVGNLQFLEMLHTGYSLERLSSAVGRLRRLMCLNVGEQCTIPPDVIGKLESLRELLCVGLSKSPHIAKELSRLVRLRVLAIKLKEMPDESLKGSLLESLGKLESLQSFHISATYNFFGHVSLDYIGEGWAPPPRNLRRFSSPFGTFSYLPSWISPSNLRELSVLHIGLDHLRQEDLDVLGFLPALRVLMLSYYENIWDEERKQWPVVRAGTFQCLQVCQFWILPTGGNMFAPGAMPKVHKLSFDCYMDDVFSLGLRNLPSLQDSLGLENLPSLRELHVCLRPSGDRPTIREEYDKAEAAIRCAADSHPNRPTLELGTTFVPSWWNNENPAS